MIEHTHMEMPLDSIGRAMARAGDDEQAAIINAFAEELRVTCRGEMGTQLCAMTHRLSTNGRELIKTIAEFVNLREHAEADS